MVAVFPYAAPSRKVRTDSCRPPPTPHRNASFNFTPAGLPNLTKPASPYAQPRVKRLRTVAVPAKSALPVPSPCEEEAVGT